MAERWQLLRRRGAAVWRRWRRHGSSLLLAAAAAGTAFVVAGLVVGPENAVFAPVAAVVATGLAAGQRLRRATEITTGVVLGLVAADLLTRLLGIGPLQLALAVLLAMGAAVALRPSGLMANQAAVAAVVVVALVPHLQSGPWVRLADAVIGGAVAVAFNAVLSPDPFRAARTTTRGVLERLATVLERLSAAVESGSLPDAEAALTDMARLDDARSEINEALDTTRERLALSRAGREARRTALPAMQGVSSRIIVLVATGRGLCRAGANLVRHQHDVDPPQPPAAVDQLVRSLRELLDALQALGPWLDGTTGPERAREMALGAAATASAAVPRTQATAAVVAQIRSATVDVLRITGLTQPEAVTALETAAGRAQDLS
ncbi:hypothetical protein GCM10028820_03610 [Tessaracoccus terricola]